MTFITPEIPASQENYMKLQEGENRIRILLDPIGGYVYWIDEEGKRKPVRVKEATDADMSKIDAKNPLKYFWAMPVWNYAKENIQIIELTQKTILKEIKNLTNDPDWGDPRKYDIVITRSGEGLDTEYSVLPKPTKELDKEAVAEWKRIEKGFKLEKLFDNENPFPTAEDETPEFLKGEKKEEKKDDAPEEIDIDEIPFG